MIDVAPIHTHRALLAALPAESSPGNHAHVLERTVMLVVIEIVRSGIVGHV